MRTRRALMVAAAMLTLAAGGCSSSDSGEESSGTTMDTRLEELAGAGVYVGGVAFTNTLVGIHFDRQPDQPPNMRIFVADGLPGGNAEWFEGKADENNHFKLTSAGGKATIEGEIDAFHTHGDITFADGTKRVFATRPAGHGAGVFETTIDANGVWTGRSLDGSTLEATQQGPTIDGFVRASNGDLYKFHHNDMTRRLGYPREGGQPDNYTMVVTRGGTEMAGRGGNVRQGQPTDNIVVLDLPASEVPTAGVYYGRVAMTTDKLAFDVNDNPDGTRQLRAYVSDGEPEPQGDIEWFTTPVTGDTFTATSKSGSATMDGTIAADGVSGTITESDGVPRRYFAAPAGDGAGIFDVKVLDDRTHEGTSEEGAKLQLKYDDGMVMGQVTAPNGVKVDLLGADLTQSYQYGVEGSLPGQYVAFAAPKGRFLIGRNGDVRGGKPGLNIIGLDKKC